MSTNASLTVVRRMPETQSLYLEWSDGYTAQQSYRYLCGYCPCAGCQGHIGKVEYRDPGTDPQPSAIEQIGNYAISIKWKDGCQDGIYSFAFLRRISESDEAGQPSLD